MFFRLKTLKRIKNLERDISRVESFIEAFSINKDKSLYSQFVVSKMELARLKERKFILQSLL